MGTSSCILCTGSRLCVPWLGGKYHEFCRKTLENSSQEFLKQITPLLLTPFEKTIYRYEHYNRGYQAALDAVSKGNFIWNEENFEADLMTKGWRAVEKYIIDMGLSQKK